MFRRNLPYLRAQVGAAVASTSPFVRILSCVIVVCYGLSFSSAAIDAFCVRPGLFFPPKFRIWTFATHSFMETHWWHALVDIVIINLYGKLLEPLWGTIEMINFYLLVNTVAGLATSFIYVMLYGLTFDPGFLFEIRIHGLPGYIAAFSVAVKQIMPDHVLLNLPLGKLRNRHVPILVLMLAIIVNIFGGVSGTYPWLFGMGLMTSWTYLRFYQKHNNKTTGDSADHFMFASFFPEPISPVVGVVANTFFSLLVRMKICKRQVHRYDLAGDGRGSITVSLPGTNAEDAERRRQIALKALNERLSKMEDATPSWPSMDDDEATTSSSSEKATTPPAAAIANLAAAAAAVDDSSFDRASSSFGGMDAASSSTVISIPDEGSSASPPPPSKLKDVALPPLSSSKPSQSPSRLPVPSFSQK